MVFVNHENLLLQQVENREKMLKLICNQMDRFLGTRKVVPSGVRGVLCSCGSR